MRKLNFLYFKPETLTGKFILIITIIFLCFLLIISIIYSSALKANERMFRETFLNATNSSLLTSARSISLSLEKGYSFTPSDIREHIKFIVNQNDSVISAVIYRSTPDENYFKPLYTVNTDKGIEIPLEDGNAVRQQKDENYLRRGLAGPVADPSIYFSGSSYWQNIYIPVKVGKRNHVIQLFISSNDAVRLFEEQSRISKRYIIYTFIALFLTAAAIACTSGWFYYNFSQLISNLTGSIRKAASGNPDVRLNEKAADPSLAELASSFNMLVEELRYVRTDSSSSRSGSDTKNLFSLGVSLMKDGKLEESIIVFESLTSIKPDSFACIFNLSVAYARSGRYQEALTGFHEAERLNPDHEKTQTYINRIQNSIKDEPERS